MKARTNTATSSNYNVNRSILVVILLVVVLLNDHQTKICHSFVITHPITSSSTSILPSFSTHHTNNIHNDNPYRSSSSITATSVATAAAFQSQKTTTTSLSASASTDHESQSPRPRRPSLIVFDLDNTLWTPELYQLRFKFGKNSDQIPIANKDIHLFPGAQKVIDLIRNIDPIICKPDDNNQRKKIEFAIASRTNAGAWAMDLLRQFDIDDLFDYIQIFSGDKKAHFDIIQSQSDIPYDEMLFFDDNRSGKYGNCLPVSSLGVLSVHCPNGIDTLDVFQRGLDAFANQWDGKPNTIVESDGTVTTVPAEEDISSKNRLRGTVKNFKEDRGFGFIAPKQSGSKNNNKKTKGTEDIFFHISALPQPYQDTGLQKGDEVSFVIQMGERGKKRAAGIEVISSSFSATATETINMRVFSMNLPFAALLANGYKTLETRNGTMFVPYEPGTKFLLHVGQRIYPDGNRHLEIMKADKSLCGDDNTDTDIDMDEKITALKSLPRGFSKGMAVAILEIGETYETTEEERCDPDIQKEVCAYGTDSGRMVTEIRRVQYLKRGVRVSGKGGVFQADVPVDAIPEGWL